MGASDGAPVMRYAQKTEGVQTKEFALRDALGDARATQRNLVRRIEGLEREIQTRTDTLNEACEGLRRADALIELLQAQVDAL